MVTLEPTSAAPVVISAQNTCIVKDKFQSTWFTVCSAVSWSLNATTWQDAGVGQVRLFYVASKLSNADWNKTGLSRWLQNDPPLVSSNTCINRLWQWDQRAQTWHLALRSPLPCGGSWVWAVCCCTCTMLLHWCCIVMNQQHKLMDWALLCDSNMHGCPQAVCKDAFDKSYYLELGGQEGIHLHLIQQLLLLLDLKSTGYCLVAIRNIAALL